ncbi:trihelix transcription factor ASR3-like [Magnolia sinica]|uniref:trihelix transcription factor ASR3-like n=1 Tax=Magnolia sinica TaxID=86752 RepID=UPI0026581FDC|nr:trihelix transcription factor ASR3-like [Magnolia sinica]
MPVNSPASVNGEPPSPAPSTNGPVNAVIDDLNRPPRLPRWTRQEILVLIEGKKVAESRVRRVGRANPTSAGSSSATVEPKWASVASYCRRHGVNRGPVQCRKRWSNLAVDFKKIKEWESKAVDGSDSFWIMRSDVRRQKKLPGFFDREVYEILDGGAADKAKIEDEAGFDDHGHDAGNGEDELVSEFDRSGRDEVVGEGGVAAPVPISEKQYEPEQGHSDPGRTNEKQPDLDPEKESTSQEGGQKRRRVSPERGGEVTNLQERLISVLDQNSKMLTAQLEAQNINCQLDRNQRAGQGESLVGVLSRVADALGRIADKL